MKEGIGVTPLKGSSTRLPHRFLHLLDPLNLLHYILYYEGF